MRKIVFESFSSELHWTAWIKACEYIQRRVDGGIPMTEIKVSETTNTAGGGQEQYIVTVVVSEPRR